MDTYWQSEFRKRMQVFGPAEANGLSPLSIKVRVTAGCFHREHSPQAYRLIDEFLAKANLSTTRLRFEEHESGPELLVYLAVTAAGLGVVKSVVELITAIIKSRSEGIKQGDKPSDPIELIVRGHDKTGDYFEETVLRIPPDRVVTSIEIEDALTKARPDTQSKKKARRK